MADEQRKFPASHAAKARRLEAAFDAYLRELDLLKKERKALKEKFMKRVEAGKLDEIRKQLKSM
ncbi:MAG TPA: hypothetical protein VL500_04990 [Candidatus Eisenbacteria bacterium]|jgi:hypothetical protein|nr:hypothetical protein [Candidatus Eisenbacteria bacterium]